MLGMADRAGTVPALKLDGQQVKTNREIARFLDQVQPGAADVSRRSRPPAEVEEAERWGDEVFQMVARRLAFTAALHGRDALVNRADDGRLGPLLWRNADDQAGRGRASSALFIFGVNAQAERELLAGLPDMLDRIDGWVEAGVLNGEELNAADFMIAPSLALLTYRRDLRPELERRPLIGLVDRVLPEPSSRLASRRPLVSRHGQRRATSCRRRTAGVLFNPRSYDPADFDEATRRALLATIDFFESRGKATLKEHDHERTWYADFLEFVKRERIFATLLTPAAEAAGDPDKRWDTARISAFSEITGFYGLAYWYTWQVTILGLGPIWQSDNAAARRRAAELLEDGAIFAFGLSEKEHGADIYSTDMVLTPDGDGGFTASGSKYYIGNGNLAGMVSVFGRRADVDGPDGYVFFAADSRHPAYRLVKNVVNSQNYVSEFRLEAYPVGAEDILHTGKDAFYAALNTVNVGKFNLGFASIGICEHAFYEAITHADGRVLYGHKVTEFPHVRQLLSDAYVRLVAMKLFSDRAIDYFRSAGADDRRYLLFNPITKMKVTTEGEKVIDDLWDVIAAKGFEKDTFFEMAARDIRGLPKLEGTVHVNMALVLKFMANYLFNPAEYPPVPPRRDAADDEFLFRQGPAKGLGKIQFNDWRASYAPFADVPNVARFMEQAEGLGELLGTAPPSEEQQTRARLPAHPGGAVHARRLRTADPRAGRADRPRRRHDRRDLRRAGARLLELRRHPARDTPRPPRPSRHGRSVTFASRSATRTGSCGSGTRSSGTRAPTRCSPRLPGRMADASAG